METEYEQEEKELMLKICTMIWPEGKFKYGEKKHANRIYHNLIYLPSHDRYTVDMELVDLHSSEENYFFDQFIMKSLPNNVANEIQLRMVDFQHRPNVAPFSSVYYLARKLQIT
jgi:hypothetical protein